MAKFLMTEFISYPAEWIPVFKQQNEANHWVQQLWDYCYSSQNGTMDQSKSLSLSFFKQLVKIQ